MLLAVLERRAGVKTGSHDVFLNVAGGIRIAEPGADLAVAAAVASSAKNRPVGQDVVAFGEVGLAGEVRRVQYAQRRIQEALRLGFGRVVAPRLLTERLEPEEASRVFQVGSLAEALELLLT
jgi:DNA repair protein RadA/Sms